MVKDSKIVDSWLAYKAENGSSWNMPFTWRKTRWISSPFLSTQKAIFCKVSLIVRTLPRSLTATTLGTVAFSSSAISSVPTYLSSEDIEMEETEQQGKGTEDQEVEEEFNYLAPAISWCFKDRKRQRWIAAECNGISKGVFSMSFFDLLQSCFNVRT